MLTWIKPTIKTPRAAARLQITQKSINMTAICAHCIAAQLNHDQTINNPGRNHMIKYSNIYVLPSANINMEHMMRKLFRTDSGAFSNC